MNIIEYLKSVGINNPTKELIEKLMKEAWISNYTWTSTQQNLMKKVVDKSFNKYQPTTVQPTTVQPTTVQPTTVNKNTYQVGNDIDLSNPKNAKGLEEAIKKIWIEWVNQQINSKWMYVNPQTNKVEKIPEWFQYDETTKNIINKYEPKNPIFEQYWQQQQVTEAEQQELSKLAEASNKPYYTRQTERLTKYYNRTVWDIDKLIQYSKTDAITNLAKNNTTFARTLQNATNAYWKRNLLWSWIQKQDIWEATNEYTKSLKNQEEYDRRKEEWYASQKDNMKTTFEEWLDTIWQNQKSQNFYDTLALVKERQAEYTRKYWDAQKNINFNPVPPVAPYSAGDLNNKNKNMLSQDEINKRNNLF
jgi:hypothetical protein